MYISEDAKIFITVLITVAVICCLFLGGLFLWRAMDEPNTDARYRIDCAIGSPGSSILSTYGWADDDEWYGKELTGFRVTQSGFWVYSTDGSVDWLSSGNACRIKEIKK